MAQRLHDRTEVEAFYRSAARDSERRQPSADNPRSRSSTLPNFRLLPESTDAERREAFVQLCADAVAGFAFDRAAFVETLIAFGIALPDDTLDHLTAIARRLGDMWLEDSCSFHDVTIGMHRLTMMLIALEPFSGDPDATPRHGGRVFLAPAPGDQHGFGLAMVGYYLRRAGWDVSAELDARDDRLVEHIGARHYDCVGFSVGHERVVSPLTQLIGRIRRKSRNKLLKIMVGGPMIVADPAIAGTMGADLWALAAQLWSSGWLRSFQFRNVSNLEMYCRSSACLCHG